MSDKNKTYTFEELNEKTPSELNYIKREKQNELYAAKKYKHILIVNILSLQNLIKEEMK